VHSIILGIMSVFEGVTERKHSIKGTYKLVLSFTPMDIGKLTHIIKVNTQNYRQKMKGKKLSYQNSSSVII